MIEEQDMDAILGCFDKIQIKSSDVFFVPGGMPDARGARVVMVEIMEPTDFAVRLEYGLIDQEQTPCFRVSRIKVLGRYQKIGDSFYLGIVTRATGMIRVDAEEWPIRTGTKFLEPRQTRRRRIRGGRPISTSRPSGYGGKRDCLATALIAPDLSRPFVVTGWL
jgi:mannose-6-phosphate isomerase class I